MAPLIEVALIGWIPLTLGLFLILRPHVATAASLAFGVAFLPALREIDVPVMPDLTQYTIPVLASFMMVVFRTPQRLIAARPGTNIGDILVIGLMVGSLITNATNTDPQVFGPTILPGMSLTDTVNDALETLVFFGLPFLMGRALVRTEQEGTDVLLVLATLALVYLPLVAIEFQVGPYWHFALYGSHPAIETFWHSVRYGGFRPNVFMNHGLTLSTFLLYCTIVASGLFRLGVRPYGLPIGPLTCVMIIFTAWCKSRAVWIYGLIAVPSLLFSRPRLNILIITIIAGGVIAYPFLRSVDVLPIKEIDAIAAEYGGQSATISFMQRIETEDDIMRRTAERYFFGWGGYARYFVYSPVTGRPLSVMDGYWVIAFGEGGIFRFLCLYGFLLFPVFYAYARFPRIRSRQAQVIVCTFAWIVILRSFDLIPNSTLDPYLTFLGGALCRVAQEASSTSAARAGDAPSRERKNQAGIPSAPNRSAAAPSSGLSAAEAGRARPDGPAPTQSAGRVRDEPDGSNTLSASLGRSLTDPSE